MVSATEYTSHRQVPAVVAQRDQVDAIVEHWRQEDPDIDVVAKTAATRLRRLSHHLERELRRDLQPQDVEMWEFEDLLALRRAPAFQLSAGALLRLCQVTSGAISNRLARLESRGWVRRDVDTRDRRQVLVSLTPEGEERAKALIAMKTEAEHRLFANLDRDVLERLAGDLRTLLLSVEGPANDDLTPEEMMAACPTQPTVP